MQWQQMSVLRLLYTLGTTAAIIAILLHVTTSAATGLGMLIGLGVAWMAFATVMCLGVMVTFLVMGVANILMALVRATKFRENVYWGLRWTAFLIGMCAILWMGGRGVYDGLQNNRLVDSEVLYERCMEPQFYTVQHVWPECSDGWTSSSIGRRGACSHHGGVVWRTIERMERDQPHSAAYCRTDASARSWVD